MKKMMWIILTLVLMCVVDARTPQKGDYVKVLVHDGKSHGSYEGIVIDPNATSPLSGERSLEINTTKICRAFCTDKTPPICIASCTDVYYRPNYVYWRLIDNITWPASTSP